MRDSKIFEFFLELLANQTERPWTGWYS